MTDTAGTSTALTLGLLSRGLNSFHGVIVIAEGQAEQRALDEATIFEARLAPDMLPLANQVALAAFFAEAILAKLGGEEAVALVEVEPCFSAAKARLQTALAVVEATGAAGLSQDPVVQMVSGQPRQFQRDAYLAEYGLPSFMFHTITGYAILRKLGFEIGKADFLMLRASA